MKKNSAQNEKNGESPSEVNHFLRPSQRHVVRRANQPRTSIGQRRESCRQQRTVCPLLELERADGFAAASAAAKTTPARRITERPVAGYSFLVRCHCFLSLVLRRAVGRILTPPTTSPEDSGSMVSRAASRRVRSAEASLVSAPEILNPKLFPDIEQPAFDNSTPRNVTTQQMQTVYLHCIVNNLGERTVSTRF
ncbi:hypothetical protein MTO96_014583 [Rhipicephalus appendiculatus]